MLFRSWVEAGMSAVVTIGGSDIYYGISKDRPDLKEELDAAMRSMEYDKPFYGDELYQRYLSAQSVAVLSSEEKEWLEQHGEIGVGFLNNDQSFSTFDKESGEMTGVINDYIKYAVDCLGNSSLKFNIEGFDSQEELLCHCICRTDLLRGNCRTSHCKKSLKDCKATACDSGLLPGWCGVLPVL